MRSVTQRKSLLVCTYYSPGHQLPAPWHDVHRSSDGAHQLSGGAMCDSSHSQGLPVADQKQQCPPDVPVGRGPASVGFGVGLREIVGRGVAPHCSSVAGHLVVVRTGWQLERHAKESPSKERPQSDAQFG